MRDRRDSGLQLRTSFRLHPGLPKRSDSSGRICTSPARLFLNQFKSPIVLILLFATSVSAVTRDWVDAMIILAIVLGSAVLSFLQEYHANTATERLRTRLTTKVSVIRDGNPQSISTEEVVPGDVGLLSAGSLVPADGVVIEVSVFLLSSICSLL